MTSRLYSEDEAKLILDAFPSDKLLQLLCLAERAKYNDKGIGNRERIVLPEGWECRVFGNCIIAAYHDDEQERKAFFVPTIWIDFGDNVFVIEEKKYVARRLALGYCSCGKRMPLLQGLLWASDMMEKKGLLALPSKGLACGVGFFLGLWIRMRPIHQYSLMFNRHPECL